ncbi:MAG: YCF48-related protein [Ignavibacteria bacterium]
MKIFNYLFISILTLIFVFTSEIHSQSSWILKSTGGNLNSVQFINDMSGFAVGDSGMIIATADGGSNWQCVTSGTTQKLRSVYFINALTGWASGDGGVIVKTTNGGINWSVLTTGTTSGLAGVHFPTIDTGYAVGPSVTIKTTNGGTNWSSLISVSGSAVFFSTGLKGVVTSATGYLSKTTNGGFYWSIASGPGYPINRYALSFINGSTGWTVGANSQIFKTTDGGSNWLNYGIPIISLSTMYGISFTDDTYGYFVGSSGQILKSTNGGVNWTVQTSGTTKTLRGVDFTDDMSGWAVGDQGILLHTSNGGTNWISQLIQYSSPFTQNMTLFDVQFQNEMTGWSVGMDGYVNKTTDGGENWVTYSSATFNYLFSIYFPNENDTGWACGRLGTIEKTLNGGVNWTLQPTGTSQHLNSIVVDYTSSGVLNNTFCVGDNGTILQLDSALTWTSHTSGTVNHLNSVFVLDDYKAIIAGNAGTILKTTDTGVNWIVKTSGTTEDLKSIYFINGLTGYVCGSSGTIRKTVDGGGSWTALTSGTTSGLNSIDFEEIVTDNGYAVGDNGTIVSTTNGGMTWNKESSGSTTPLYSIFAGDVPALSSMTSTVVNTVGKLGKFAYKNAVTALPVELTSFDYSINENKVTLRWHTSGEINNRGFEIERKSSSVSLVEWSDIGFMDGYGTINELVSYTYEDKYLLPGKYKYRLKQIDYNGNFKYYELNSEVIIGAPEKYVLSQNYPNPFNPVTKIKYQIPEDQFVSIKVYDILGKQIQILQNNFIKAGSYEIKFESGNLPGGIYFYKIETQNYFETKKMILLK